MIDRRRLIPLFISFGVTAFVLIVTMICFYNLDMLTDVTQSVLNYGLMFLLTLCKPVLIAYAVLGGIYVTLAVIMGVTARTKFSIKFAVIISAILGIFFLVAQVLLWVVAVKSPVLIVATLISECAYVANFVILNKTYQSVYGK